MRRMRGSVAESSVTMAPVRSLLPSLTTIISKLGVQVINFDRMVETVLAITASSLYAGSMTDKLRGVMKRCGFDGGGMVIMFFLLCVKTLKRIPTKDKATVPAIAATLARLLQRKPLTENLANSIV